MTAHVAAGDATDARPEPSEVGRSVVVNLVESGRGGFCLVVGVEALGQQVGRAAGCAW